MHGAVLLLCALGSLTLIAASAPAQVLLVSPAIDRNDRIAAILQNANPPLRLERVRLFGRPNRPEGWRRSIGERKPVELDGVRLVVLENAAASGLADIRVAAGGSLLNALPGWLESGGHLLAVGGWPSFDTYSGTPLERILPAEIAEDAEAMRYRKFRLRSLEGGGSDGAQVRHVHPVESVSGEVLIQAGSEPFAVHGRVSLGEVTLVLGGTQEHFIPDTGSDEKDFFASQKWERFVLDRAARALGESLRAGRHVDLAELSLPTLRVGQKIRPGDWFGEERRGNLTLFDPSGREVLSVKIPAPTQPILPYTLRPGRYEAVLKQMWTTRRRTVRIGTAVDLDGFDIRFFLFGHRPGPLGLAPGEAYDWAVELAKVGFTSTVYASYVKRPHSNMRSMREILHGGLNIVYYQTFRYKSGYPNHWPSRSTAPPAARDLAGKAVGWDIHSPAFRSEIEHLFDGLDEVLALPGIRAIQLIEENRDGGLRSPSLQSQMARRGLTGEEQPGDPGWLVHEDLRSQATRITYQRFRSVGKRAFPGVPHASYWPGSYWRRPRFYTHRVSDFAATIDELLGPGYGYDAGRPPHGWLSVVRTSDEIFNAHNFDLSGSKGMAVYAQGYPITPGGGRQLGIDTWRETAWTALAKGATSLAYFGLPHGEAIRPLAELHAELHRLGPWIASARRRPAAVAVLAAWSTRTGGSQAEAKRHYDCVQQLHDILVYGIEEVDFVREEQLSALPPDLEVIVLTAAALLPERTIDQLRSFVSGGGHLFVDSDSGKREPNGLRSGDPWQPVRSTGRVHDVSAVESCTIAGRFELVRNLLATRWREQLAKIGIEPLSSTPAPWTQARLSGDGEFRYWVFLNHRPESRTLKAHARIPASDWLWRDLRTNRRVRPAAEPGGMGAEVQVGPNDAVVWAGSRRPTATLEIEPCAEWHRIVVEVTALDVEGRPVPDTTPLHLSLRNADGREMLPANLRSRATRSGRASWRLPIPAEDRGGNWSIHVEAPLAGLSAIDSIEVAPPPSPSSNATLDRAPSPEASCPI